MGFVAQVSTGIEKMPRIYVHSTGLRDLGLFNDDGPYHELSAIRFGLDTYKSVIEAKLPEGEHALACVWGRDDGLKRIPTPMIDLRIWGDIGGWNEGNPTITPAAVVGNFYNDLDSFTCGDFLIACGFEEALRRSVRNMDFYMRHAPTLPDLVLEPDFVYYDLTR